MQISISPKSFAGRIGFWTAVVIGIVLIIGIGAYSGYQSQQRAKAQAEQISSQFEEYLDKVRLIIEDISKRRQQSIVNPALREFGPGLIWDIAHSHEAYIDAVALYEGNQLKGNTEDTDAWVDKEDLQSKDEKPRMELRVIQYPPGVSGFVKPALYVAYPIDKPQEEKHWKIFLRVGIPRDTIIAPNIPPNSIFLIAPDDRIIVADDSSLINSKYSSSLRDFIQSERPIRVEEKVLGSVVVRVPNVLFHLIISVVVVAVIGFSIFKALEWQIEPPLSRLIEDIEELPTKVNPDSEMPFCINGTNMPSELGKIADASNKMAEQWHNAERKRARLQQYNLTLGFLVNISHKLSHDLHPIGTFIDQTNRKRDVRENSQVLKEAVLALENMRSKIDRMRYVKCFLKPEELIVVRRNVKDLIDDVVQNFESEAKANLITIENEIDKEIFVPSHDISNSTQRKVINPLDLDPLKLIFDNLISNSIYSIKEKKDNEPPGQYEGKITISAEEFEYEGKDWVSLIFSDNGNGIKEEDKEKILNLFFTTKSDGTGIGLILARIIAESLGGKIFLAFSKEGEGSTFKINLPVFKESDR